MTTFSPVSRTHGASRCLASRLIGCSLTNAKGEGAGTIDELVFDGGNRRVAYVVVSFGGFLGLGSKRFAMPWHRLTVGDRTAGGRCATLDVAREDLEAAPGFDTGHWPDFADVRWAAFVETRYRPGSGPESVAPLATGAPTMAAAGHGMAGSVSDADAAHHRLGQLIGMDVVDAQHQALASIEDLVVDVRRGAVDGVLLAFGGVLGIGERTVLVPADTLAFDPDESVFVIASNRERLEMMAIAPGEWPDLDTEDWLVGGRERLAMARDDVAVRDGVETVVPAAAGEVPVSAAVGFGGLDEQVHGIIVTMGSASRESRGEPRLRIRVRSVDGREVVVLAGALGNKDQEALALRSGQTVDVRGWRAKQGPRSLLVAGSITVDGKTLVLDAAPRGEIAVS